jgi:hypothetical protein
MKTPAEAARTVRSCFLCGDTRIAAVGFVVPVDDVTLDALLKLRSEPLGDDETPTVWFGLCRAHAAHPQRSAACVQAQIVAAAEQVVVN